MPPALQDRLRKHALPILCLALVPVIVAIIHDDWLYTPIDYLDPWYNVGFFLNYFDPTFLPGHYKEARLSWLAPGWLAYKTLGPMAANFILHIGPLVAATVLVYLTLARLASRNAAFLAAALLCAYYPFHNSGGWDYQTTPSGAFYALTLYLLTRAAQSARPAAWLMGAGAAYGATFHADILFVNMAPVLAAHYLVVAARRPTVKAIARVAGWTVLGFAILTQALCMVAWSAGRNAMFFQPLVDIVFSYTMEPHKYMSQWWLPTSSGWFLQRDSMRYLVVPAGIGLAGLAWLAVWAFKLCGPGRRTQIENGALIRVMLIGQFVFLFLLWIVWQSMGHVALEPDYFAYPLIVPAFIALGALVGAAGRRDLILLGAVLFAVMLSSLAKPMGVPLLDVRLAYWLAVSFIVAAILAGFLLPRAKAAAVVIAAAVFLVCYPVIRPVSLWSQLRGTVGDCSSPRNDFSEIVRLHVLLRQGGIQQQTWVWNGPATPQKSRCNIPLDAFRWALLSTGVSSLAGGLQPSAALLSDADIATPRYGDRVAAVVWDKADAAPLVTRFTAGGRELALESEGQVKFDGRHAVLLIYKITS